MIGYRCCVLSDLTREEFLRGNRGMRSNSSTLGVCMLTMNISFETR